MCKIKSSLRQTSLKDSGSSSVVEWLIIILRVTFFSILILMFSLTFIIKRNHIFLKLFEMFLAYLCGFIIQFFTWDIAVMKSKMYSHVEIAGFHIHTWEYYRLENVQHLRFYTGVHTQCWSVQSICSTCLWLTLLILMKPVRIYVVFQKIGQSPMDGMSVFRHNTVDLLKCNLPITQQHDHNHDVVWVIINRLCKV